MDYKQTPPPGWETRTPDEWDREAFNAQAMYRNALHYAPELVGMFRAWAVAWEARNKQWEACKRDAEEHARASITAAADGRNDDARRSFHLAVQAEGDARGVRALSYRSFLETIPNLE